MVGDGRRAREGPTSHPDAEIRVVAKAATGDPGRNPESLGTARRKLGGSGHSSPHLIGASNGVSSGVRAVVASAFSAEVGPEVGNESLGRGAASGLRALESRLRAGRRNASGAIRETGGDTEVAAMANGENPTALTRVVPGG